MIIAYTMVRYTSVLELELDLDPDLYTDLYLDLDLARSRPS